MTSNSVPAISAAANTTIIRTTKTHWRGVMVHDPRADGLERQAARERSKTAGCDRDGHTQDTPAQFDNRG